MSVDTSLLEKGIYTLPQAARLLSIPVAKIHRWMKCTVVRRKGKEYTLQPLWLPQLPAIGDAVALSFLDLQELRLVDYVMREEKLRLAKIRAFLLGWRSISTEYPYPLINDRVRLETGGGTLIAKLRDDDASLDLATMQYLMAEVIRTRVVDLDYEGRDLPSRWWPAGKGGPILVSPDIEFGDPVTRDGGVPTHALATAVGAQGKGSEAAVARMFEVPLAAVLAAVSFEQNLRKGRAAA